MTISETEFKAIADLLRLSSLAYNLLTNADENSYLANNCLQPDTVENTIKNGAILLCMGNDNCKAELKSLADLGFLSHQGKYFNHTTTVAVDLNNDAQRANFIEFMAKQAASRLPEGAKWQRDTANREFDKSLAAITKQLDKEVGAVKENARTELVSLKKICGELGLDVRADLTHAARSLGSLFREGGRGGR